MATPMVPGAYYLRHLPTGCYYIGSTRNLCVRLSAHKKALQEGTHSNPRLKEIFTRWEDFSFEMHICDTREEAYAKEQEMLEEHAGDRLLCNVSLLARGTFESTGALKAALVKMKAEPPTHWVGRNHSEKTRALLSEQRLGKKRNLDPEARQSLSSRMKGNQLGLGRKQSEESKLKTAMAKWKPVSVNGIDYPSIGHAAKALGLLPALVGMRVRHSHPKWAEWKFLAR